MGIGSERGGGFGWWSGATIRLRLTLLFLAQFLAASVALMLLTWFVFQHGSLLSRPLAPPRYLPPPPPAAAQAEIAARMREARQALAQNQRDLVLRSLEALGVTAILVVAAGWWIAGRFLAPLQRITGTARRLSDRTLHERIGLQGPQDELKELADTFDGMLERLEAAFESQRRFIANVSHELRTPLAAQQALVEVVLADPNASAGELRSALEGVRAAALDQQRIVQGLLTLALSERALERRDLVDMAALARIAIDQLGNEVAHRGLTVEASLQRSRVLGDPTLLRRMVENLLENAVRHNRSGGWIRVESSEADGHVRIVVTNSGDEVPATIAPLLIEPFTRLAGQRTHGKEGLGLGLSIVRAVSTAHSGQLRVEPWPGGGLRVRVRLPAMERTQRYLSDPGPSPR